MEIITKAPASCGELIEGVIDGTPFLVTCPISMYAEVTVSDTFTGVHGLGEKAREAMERTLQHIGEKKLPWGIRLDSKIPQGKGMASSSADIAAVSYAVARTLGWKLTPQEMMDIAIAIEPSDGICFEGLAHVSHTTGKLFAQYSDVPLLHISIYDVGGIVDTIAYYQSKSNQRNQNIEYQRLLNMVDRAFHAGAHRREALLGMAATESALLNQEHLKKEGLKELIRATQDEGALGVTVAHSGTVVGVLWASAMSAADVSRRTERLAHLFDGQFSYLQTARLIPGGVICEIKA